MENQNFIADKAQEHGANLFERYKSFCEPLQKSIRTLSFIIEGIPLCVFAVAYMLYKNNIFADGYGYCVLAYFWLFVGWCTMRCVHAGVLKSLLVLHNYQKEQPIVFHFSLRFLLTNLFFSWTGYLLLFGFMLINTNLWLATTIVYGLFITIFGARLQFMSSIIIDRHVGILSALCQSWRMTRGISRGQLELLEKDIRVRSIKARLEHVCAYRMLQAQQENGHIKG